MKFIKYTSISLFLLVFYSCQITENLILNQDGSGKFNYEIDASSMLKMMEDTSKENDNSTIKDKKKKRKKKDIQVAQEKTQKVIDTTLNFKDFLTEKQDSIAQLSPEEQQKIKQLEKFEMRMVMNQAKKEFKYYLMRDFSKITELQEMASPIKTIKSSGLTDKIPLQDNQQTLLQEHTTTTYFYDGKTFKKEVTQFDSKKEIEKIIEEKNELPTTENDITEEDTAAFAENLINSMESIYQNSFYKAVYIFEKPVKSISSPDAQISEDKKTVIIIYDLKEYMTKPDFLNLEIVFE